MACLLYRAANYALCLAAAADGGGLTRALFAAIFRLHCWRRGVRMRRISDPALAKLVLQVKPSGRLPVQEPRDSWSRGRPAHQLLPGASCPPHHCMPARPKAAAESVHTVPAPHWCPLGPAP